MECYIVCTIRRGHVIRRGQEKIKIRRPCNRTNKEILETSVNDGISRKTPRSGCCGSIKGNRFPIGRDTIINVKEKLTSVWVIQGDGVSESEVT